MVRYDEVLRKAQEEIDPVVGRSRPPTSGGRPSSPYIEVMLTETLRWGSLVPLSASSHTLPWRSPTPHADFSHLSLEDDYDDHRIPKGFLRTSFLYGLQHAELVLFQVLGNLWVMSRDERIYLDPGVFRPEVFLGYPRTKVCAFTLWNFTFRTSNVSSRLRCVDGT